MTWAKKEILGMSEDDIKLDIQRQAVEKAGGEELKMLAETIKQTGLFREIYKAYKINPENMTTAGVGGSEDEPGSELDTAISSGGSDVGTDFTTPLDTPEISDELNQAYSQSGITHILAVSGMHVGLVFLAIGFLLKQVKNKD
jgi:hypothetical protein